MLGNIYMTVQQACAEPGVFPSELAESSHNDMVLRPWWMMMSREFDGSIEMDVELVHHALPAAMSIHNNIN